MAGERERRAILDGRARNPPDVGRRRRRARRSRAAANDVFGKNHSLRCDSMGPSRACARTRRNPRSILAVGGARRRRRARRRKGDGEQNACRFARPRDSSTAPVKDRRARGDAASALDLLATSLGVVKSRAACRRRTTSAQRSPKVTSFRPKRLSGNRSVAPSRRVDDGGGGSSSGRSRFGGRIVAFRSSGATPRFRGRLRAAATDELVPANASSRAACDARAGAHGRRPPSSGGEKTERGGAVVAPTAFSFGSADAAPPCSRSAPRRRMRRSKSARGGKRTTTPCRGGAARVDERAGEFELGRDPTESPPKPETPSGFGGGGGAPAARTGMELNVLSGRDPPGCYVAGVDGVGHVSSQHAAAHAEAKAVAPRPRLAFAAAGGRGAAGNDATASRRRLSIDAGSTAAPAGRRAFARGDRGDGRLNASFFPFGFADAHKLCRRPKSPIRYLVRFLLFMPRAYAEALLATLSPTRELTRRRHRARFPEAVRQIEEQRWVARLRFGRLPTRRGTEERLKVPRKRRSAAERRSTSTSLVAAAAPPAFAQRRRLAKRLCDAHGAGNESQRRRRWRRSPRRRPRVGVRTPRRFSHVWEHPAPLDEGSRAAIAPTVPGDERDHELPGAAQAGATRSVLRVPSRGGAEPPRRWNAARRVGRRTTRGRRTAFAEEERRGVFVCRSSRGQRGARPSQLAAPRLWPRRASESRCAICSPVARRGALTRRRGRCPNWSRRDANVTASFAKWCFRC